MNALIDTCVVMDFLQRREPFADNAKKIFSLIATNKIKGYITAKSVTDIYYLLHHYTHSDADTRQLLNSFLGLVEILDTAAEDILLAMSSNISDYEDAVLVETAKRTNMDCIVTRNIKDFAKSSITILTPEKLLKAFR